jgi:hypothetical protein
VFHIQKSLDWYRIKEIYLCICKCKGPQCYKRFDAPRCPHNRHVKVVRLLALCNGHLDAYPQEIFLELISVRGWFDPRAIVWPEELSQWQIAVTPLGIKPATFWRVGQYLSQPRHCVTRNSSVTGMNLWLTYYGTIWSCTHISLQVLTEFLHLNPYAMLLLFVF